MSDGTSLLRSGQPAENPFLAFQPIPIAPEERAPEYPSSEDEIEPPERSKRTTRNSSTQESHRRTQPGFNRPKSHGRSNGSKSTSSIRSPKFSRDGAGATSTTSTTSSLSTSDPFAIDESWAGAKPTSSVGNRRPAQPPAKKTNPIEEDFLFGGDFMSTATSYSQNTSTRGPNLNSSNPFEEVNPVNPFESIADPFQAFDETANIFDPTYVAGAPPPSYSQATSTTTPVAPPQPTRTHSRRMKRRHTAPVGSIDSAVEKLRADNARDGTSQQPPLSANGKGKPKRPTARIMEADESDSDDDLEVPVTSPKQQAEKKRRASAPVKPTLFDCIDELHRGTALLKYGRRGYPHFRQFQLSGDNAKLQWFSKKKGIADSSIDLKDINEVRTGQTTPEFERVGWTSLAPASFSILYANRSRRLSLVAKSVDEQKMWVEALRFLRDKARKGHNMSEVDSVLVHVDYRDRNRPQSRRHSGKFVRGHETNERNVDNLLHKKLISDVASLKERFRHVAAQANHQALTTSPEIESIRQILSELEERLEELDHEVRHTRDTKIAENDVWRTKVDLEALEEKIQVLIRPKRRWSIKKM